MKNQKQTSKLAAFAKEAIDTKQMKQVQGGQWHFWNWLGGGVGATGGIA
jgi:hypothetical protein